MARYTVKQQLQGFPVRQMVVISLVRISEPIALTSLFPYLYFMIRDFQIAKQEKDIPRFSGYLAASFSFCQLLFAIQWGKLSDRIGRKLVLLIGLIGTSISLISFGFSTNFYFAMISRGLSGALNGNLSVLRTVVGEIAHEKRHQPIAFSTLPLFFNLGSVVGPMIGGYFANPNPHNPYQDKGEMNVLEKLTNKYPYLMSNIVVVFFVWFSFICGALFLEETHENFKYRRDYGVDLGDCLLTKLGYPCPVRPWNMVRNKRVLSTSPTPTPVPPTEETELLDDSCSINSEDSIHTYNGDTVSIDTRVENAVANALIKTYSNNEMIDFEDNHSRGRQNYRVDYSGAFTPRVISVMLGNFILSLHNMTYSEFLPVFLAGNFKPDRLKFPFTIVGGFGWNTKSIGTLISSTGIMGILIILLIFPFIDSKLGTINGYRLSTTFFPLVYLLVPFTIFTLKEYNDSYPKWLSTAVLYSLTALKTLASSTGLPQINILNHRAAAPQHRIYVNSTIMSTLAFANFSAPLIFGWLMSVGENHEIGWLIWWIMAALSIVGMVQLFWLEDYDEE